MDDWQSTPSSNNIIIIIVIILVVVGIIILLIAVWNSGNSNSSNTSSQQNNNGSIEEDDDDGSSGGGSVGSPAKGHKKHINPSMGSSANTLKPVFNLHIPKVNGKQEAPKVELPKAEPPNVELPKAEPPKVELPKRDPPNVELTKVEQAKVEAPKVEAPDVESNKVEPTTIEPAVAEPPKDEPPKIETFKQETVPVIPVSNVSVIPVSNVSVPVIPLVSNIDKAARDAELASVEDFDVAQSSGCNKLKAESLPDQESNSIPQIPDIIESNPSKDSTPIFSDLVDEHKIVKNDESSIPSVSPMYSLPETVSGLMNASQNREPSKHITGIRECQPQLDKSDCQPKPLSMIPYIKSVASTAGSQNSSVIDETSGLSIDASMTNPASMSSDFSSPTEKSVRNTRKKPPTNPFKGIADLAKPVGRGRFNNYKMS